MNKSRFFVPYLKNGKVAEHISKAKNKSGVYFIKPTGKSKPVYVGHSRSDLYKTILRHFQSWNDKTQIRIVYPKYGYVVRVVLTSPKRAENLERAYIIKHKPKDNPNKLELFTKLTTGEENALSEYESKDVAPF